MRDTPKSNSRNNKNPFAKIVDKIIGKESDSKPAAQPTAEESNKQLVEYLQGQGLFDGIDMKGFVEAVNAGDAEKAMTLFQTSMLNTAKVSIGAANKLQEAKVARVSEDLMDRTKQSQERELAKRQMNDKMPWTKNENRSKLAEDVLNGFLDQGFATDEAIKNTHDYFKEMATEQGAKFDNPPSSKPGQRGFQNSNYNENSPEGNTAEPVDFVKMLTGDAQSYEDLNPPAKSAAEPAPAATAEPTPEQ